MLGVLASKLGVIALLEYWGPGENHISSHSQEHQVCDEANKQLTKNI